MSQWKNTDAAANSVIWAAAQLKVTPNTANRDALYGNTTANAFVEGATVAMVAVDANEVAATPDIAHTGWVLRTVGSGGRAGRVQYEVLVAGGITSDGSDDTLVPDYSIVISSQPANATVNAASTTANQATFTVTADTRPSGGTITYLWQANTGSGFVNAAAGTTGNTTATLTVNANTFTNASSFRVVMSVSGGANVTSQSALLIRTS